MRKQAPWAVTPILQSRTQVKFKLLVPLPFAGPPQNFFHSPAMAVTIGGQPCANVTVTDVVGLGEFTCRAPPGPGAGVVQLRVSIDSSGSATTRFLYDPPDVTSVVGAPCDATLPCPLQVRGWAWAPWGGALRAGVRMCRPCAVGAGMCENGLRGGLCWLAVAGWLCVKPPFPPGPPPPTPLVKTTTGIGPQPWFGSVGRPRVHRTIG